MTQGFQKSTKERQEERGREKARKGIKKEEEREMKDERGWRKGRRERKIELTRGGQGESEGEARREEGENSKSFKGRRNLTPTAPRPYTLKG